MRHITYVKRNGGRIAQLIGDSRNLADYVGTDDGNLQVTEDGGRSWRKIASFPGVPAQTYVSYLFPSWFDPNVVFAAFDDHQRGDFTPFLLRSDDKGATWTSIAGDLPKRGTVYTIVQDFEKPELLFAGTEFGLFFTLDGGRKWIQLKGGLPPIAVRDLAIQRRANDLVLATFGRGFFVLDDYSALRRVSKESLDRADVTFTLAKSDLLRAKLRLLRRSGFAATDLRRAAEDGRCAANPAVTRASGANPPCMSGQPPNTSSCMKSRSSDRCGCPSLTPM